MSHSRLRTVQPQSPRPGISRIHSSNVICRCNCTSLSSGLKRDICISHPLFFLKGTFLASLRMGGEPLEPIPALPSPILGCAQFAPSSGYVIHPACGLSQSMTELALYQRSRYASEYDFSLAVVTHPKRGSQCYPMGWRISV